MAFKKKEKEKEKRGRIRRKTAVKFIGRGGLGIPNIGNYINALKRN